MSAAIANAVRRQEATGRGLVGCELSPALTTAFWVRAWRGKFPFGLSPSNLGYPFRALHGQTPRDLPRHWDGCGPLRASRCRLLESVGRFRRAIGRGVPLQSG